MLGGHGGGGTARLNIASAICLRLEEAHRRTPPLLCSGIADPQNRAMPLHSTILGIYTRGGSEFSGTTPRHISGGILQPRKVEKILRRIFVSWKNRCRKTKSLKHSEDQRLGNQEEEKPIESDAPKPRVSGIIVRFGGDHLARVGRLARTEVLSLDAAPKAQGKRIKIKSARGARRQVWLPGR